MCPRACRVGRNRDHTGAGAPLQPIQEQVGQQEGCEVVERERALESVWGDVPAVPVTTNVVDQDVDAGEALEHLAGEAPDFRL